MWYFAIILYTVFRAAPGKPYTDIKESTALPKARNPTAFVLIYVRFCPMRAKTKHQKISRAG
jgi:hypothetical protein